MSGRPVALITGASRGIGAATARLAAQRGYAVCVNYASDSARAERVAAELRASGAGAIAVRADTAREDEVGAMFERVERELGRLALLVNNAGIIGQAGRLDETDAASARRVMDVNVVGVLNCSREAIKRMSRRRGGEGGAIVNVSSVAATHGGANQWLAYAASKGAVNTFTLGLAREVAGEGIRVNAILPGLIDTEIRANAGLGHLDAQILPMIPMGRMGTAEECAEAILWLASEQAAYVTGAVLPVTGGR